MRGIGPGARATRLLSLIMLLQARGRMSATLMARELEVSVRTVLRDMEELSLTGIPVYAERGRDGGFVLDPSYATKLTGLSVEEAHALVLAGMPKAATDLGLARNATTARLKVLSALPKAQREQAQKVADRLHIDAVDWYRSAPVPACLTEVARAVWGSHYIATHYAGWRTSRRTLLRPLGLVQKAGTWYLVAVPANRRAPRTYRLSQMQETVVLRRSFAPPPGFSLASYWQKSVARFEEQIYTAKAVLWVTPQGLRDLSLLATTVYQRALAGQTAVKERRGWLRVVIPIESVEHAASNLLRLGEHVEVRAPSTLRTRLATVAKAVAQRHSGRVSGAG